VELGLVAGHDYPDTYREFVEMFPDNTACVAYLTQVHGQPDKNGQNTAYFELRM